MKKGKKVKWSIISTIIFAIALSFDWMIFKNLWIPIFFAIAAILFGGWLMIMLIFWSCKEGNYAEEGRDYPLKIRHNANNI